MAYIIGVISQKGGVGKSTLARAIAREYTAHELDVLIADMDIKQSTSSDWNVRRQNNDIKPYIQVQVFNSVKTVLSKSVNKYDIIVFDGAPHASEQSLQIASCSDIIILPTGETEDDLIPTVRLAHELRKKGIPKDKMLFVLSRVSKREALEEEAENYILEAGYQVAKNALPEQAIYKRASDLGQTVTELTHKGCNQKAESVIQNIMDLLKQRIDNGNEPRTNKKENKAEQSATA